MLVALGLKVEIHPPDLDESVLPHEKPAEHAARLAVEKAAVITENIPDRLVLAADTVIGLDGRIVGKPSDAAEAASLLRAMSGRWHSVFTGYALRGPAVEISRVIETRVKFRDLPDKEIDAYVASGEGLDKAGAYAIQGGAAHMVEKIDGSYTNVVGLPLAEVWVDLKTLENDD